MMTLGLDKPAATAVMEWLPFRRQHRSRKYLSLIQYVNRVAVRLVVAQTGFVPTPNGGMAESVAAAIFSTLTLLSIVSRMNALVSFCATTMKPGAAAPTQIVLVSVAVVVSMMPIAPLPPVQVGVAEAGNCPCMLTRILPVVAVAVIKVGTRSVRQRSFPVRELKRVDDRHGMALRVGACDK